MGNPKGFVIATDFGNPKIIQGIAKTDLTGGDFVIGSSATGVVSSGLDTYVTADIEFSKVNSSSGCNGVVVQTTSSGGVVPVAVEGVLIVNVHGTVTAGTLVETGSNLMSVQNLSNGSFAEGVVGRAISAGTSGTTNFALVHIKP